MIHTPLCRRGGRLCVRPFVRLCTAMCVCVCACVLVGWLVGWSVVRVVVVVDRGIDCVHVCGVCGCVYTIVCVSLLRWSCGVVGVVGVVAVVSVV